MRRALGSIAGWLARMGVLADMGGALGAGPKPASATALGQLRAGLEAGGAVILELDAFGRIAAINDNGAALLDLGPAGDLVGRDWFATALPDQDRASAGAAFRALLDSGASASVRVDTAVRRRDGSLRLIGWRHAVRLDGDDRVVGTISIGEDVTEARAAAARAAVAERQQSLLLELEDRLRGEDDPHQVKSAAAAFLAEALAADRVGYTEVDAEAGTGRVQCACGSAALPANAGAVGPLAIFADMIDLLSAGHPLVMTDILADPRFPEAARHPLVRTSQVRAVLDTPLVKHGRLVAVLNVNHASPRTWTDDEVALARSVAERTWAAVERAIADRRLRDSEERLQFALAAADLGTWDLDLTSDRAVTRSLRHDQIFGYAELQPHWGLEIAMRHVLPEDRPLLQAAYERAVATGMLDDIEVRVRWPDGSIHWIAPRGRTYPDASGAPMRMAGVVADVTARVEADAARRAAELALRDNAERVQLALAAGAIIGTWFWDLPADNFTLDEAFAQSFGLDPRLGREGMGLDQVIATVHPDDVDGLRQAIAEAIARGGRYAHQYRVRRADGRYYWIEANGRVDHGPDGTPLAFPGVLLDVEERRALVEEKNRAKRLLETFIEAVPGVVFAKDRSGRLIVANRGVADLIGKPLDDILGRTDAEVLDDAAQAQAVMANDRRIMDSGITEQLEEAVSFPDGRRAIWLSTKSPLHDADGAVVGLIGTSVDITARKDAEQHLAESEAMVRRVLDQLFAFVAVLAPDGVLIEANAAPLDAAGISLADVAGKPFWDAWWWSYDAAVQQRLREACRAAAQGSTVRYDVPVRMAGGALLTIDFQIAPLRDQAGRITHLIPSGIVVEDRVQAESELKRLNAELEARVAEALEGRRMWAEVIEATDAFIQVIDTDMRLLAINRATMLEYESRFQVRARIGDHLPTLFAGHSEQREIITSLCARALAGESFTATTAFGEEEHQRRWYESKFSPLHDGQGRLIGATHFSYDVTEREARQRALATTQAQLHEIQKLETIGQLTGGVAHDFNNLLTPIMGSLDMLRRRVAGDGRAERQAIAALEAAERAKTLVARLLTFARRQMLESRPVDVRMLLDGLSDLVVRTIGPGVQVVVELPDQLPAAQVDPNQLELAILNLAVNARDAMPVGGRLTMGAHVADVGIDDASGLPAGRYVCLSVSDTGVGMDPETLRRAIEPFYSTKGVGKGTGLGLSMVHGLAAQSGGSLILSSVPGEGTRAEIWLPVAAAHADHETVTAHEPVRARGCATILLVDDEDLVRIGTAELLRDLGYDVIEAGSGAAALDRLRRGEPIDLLVTDYLMSGMTGIELVASARETRPGLLALMITGYAARTEMLPDDVPRLAKPFRQAELAERVAALLEDGKVVRLKPRGSTRRR